jgi:hypothetical protein
LLRLYISTASSIPWNVIQFAGSKLTDIAIRLHNSLQSIQGGQSGEYYHLTAAEYAALGTATVPDGDKGDITVSGSGATWTIDSNVVTNAKLADMSGHTIKARVGGASGDPSDLAMSSHSALIRNGGDVEATAAGNNTVLRRTTGNTLEFGTINTDHITNGAVTAAKTSITGTPTGSKYLRDDFSWQAVSGGGGGTWTEVEIDFGATPKYDATFTITDAAITSSAVKIALVPCGKAATGRTADDWQWDGGTFVANPGTGSATCYATFHPGPIVGRRTLQYQIG